MNRTRVVIQSRLTSTRLPGKALLTIGGMALIELVARRAGRSGHEVVVATSVEHYDRRKLVRRVDGRGTVADVGALMLAALPDGAG